MQIDTKKTIYIGIDSPAGEVRVLLPKGCQYDIVALMVGDQNPESTDAAEYELAETEMDEHRFDM